MTELLETASKLPLTATLKSKQFLPPKPKLLYFASATQRAEHFSYVEYFPLLSVIVALATVVALLSTYIGPLLGH